MCVCARAHTHRTTLHARSRAHSFTAPRKPANIARERAATKAGQQVVHTGFRLGAPLERKTLVARLQESGCSAIVRRHVRRRWLASSLIMLLLIISSRKASRDRFRADLEQSRGFVCSSICSSSSSRSARASANLAQKLEMASELGRLSFVANSVVVAMCELSGRQACGCFYCRLLIAQSNVQCPSHCSPGGLLHLARPHCEPSEPAAASWLVVGGAYLYRFPNHGLFSRSLARSLARSLVSLCLCEAARTELTSQTFRRAPSFRDA